MLQTCGNNYTIAWGVLALWGDEGERHLIILGSRGDGWVLAGWEGREVSNSLDWEWVMDPGGGNTTCSGKSTKSAPFWM